MWGADPNRPDRDSIEIEERDPAELRSCRGKPTTIEEIEAYYPAFDITPPHMVSGIITAKGIFSPYDLARHFV
jgi:methylthioribose-1-phosphate isomerase